MKKIFIILFSVLMIVMVDHQDASAQRRRGNGFFKSLFSSGNNRKSSRRISSFKGRNSTFNRDVAYMSIGGSLNAFNYFGDLAPNPKALSTDISFTRPGLGFTVTQKIGDRYHWRGDLMWGRIKGSDANSADLTFDNVNRYARNLSFRNDLVELSMVAMIDLIPYSGRFSTRPVFTPYIFFGAAVYYSNPKALVPKYYYPNENFNSDGTGIETSKGGQWVSLRKYGTEGQNYGGGDYQDIYGRSLPKKYSPIGFAVPMGIGARYKLAGNLDLSFELGYRQLFSDYIDDVSNNYVDLGVFVKDPNNITPEEATALALADRSFDRTQADYEQMADKLPVNRIVTVSSKIAPGMTYRRLAGYGQEAPTNVRGNKKNNDMYFVTSFHLTYILGSQPLFRRAKYR